MKVSWGTRNDANHEEISNLARSPTDNVLHFIFLRQLGKLGPIGQEAFSLWGEASEAIQGWVREGSAAVGVCLYGSAGGLGVLYQGERSLQLHNALAYPSISKLAPTRM